MRQLNNKREENFMGEKRILLNEHDQYRDCGACRRWKDKPD